MGTKNSITAEKQIFTDFITTEITTLMNKFGNWKSPGIDNIQNFWWLKFTNTHPYLTKSFNFIMKYPENCPEWFTTGRTTLVLLRDRLPFSV